MCESLDKEFIEIVQRAEGKDGRTVRTSVIKANDVKRKSKEKCREIGILKKIPSFFLKLSFKKQQISGNESRSVWPGK